jgi:hypothetical protein
MVIFISPEMLKQNPELLPPNYGLGWFVQAYRDIQRVEHGGNTAGFTALVSFMPEKKAGIVVLMCVTHN